jgi:hypothetical protein
MNILLEKMKSIKNFLYILLALLLVNAVFNLNYDWGGVSIIVRVYIMVLSFYIIYIFSQIDPEKYRNHYKEKYGWAGDYILFFIFRGFPFLFIFLMTAAFIIVSAVHLDNWPANPFFRVMDGKYSNTIFYSLILLLVLKQNKRPGIAIPLFILYSVVFFIFHKALSASFEPGYGVGGVKLIKYFIFMFVLFYDSLYKGGKAVKSAAAAVVTGMFLFFFVIAVNCLIFNFSGKQGYAYTYSARLLLKTGVKYPLDELEKIIPGKHGMVRVVDFINYSIEYKEEIDYTAEQWGDIIIKSDIGTADFIFDYIYHRDIEIDFNLLRSYANNQSKLAPSAFLGSDYFKRYFARYFPGREKDYFEMYREGPLEMKLWIIDTLEYTDTISAAEFIINYLTDVDRQISERAYIALMGITGLDPAAEKGKNIYDLEVVSEFRDFLESRRDK